MPSIVSNTGLTPRGTCSREETGEIKLYLETDIDVRMVDCWTPPQLETTITDPVETRPLRVHELSIVYRLFEARHILPKQTFPGWEVCALE